MPDKAIFSDSIESVRAVEDVRGFTVLGFHYAGGVLLASDRYAITVDASLLAAITGTLHRVGVYDTIRELGRALLSFEWLFGGRYVEQSHLGTHHILRYQIGPGSANFFWLQLRIRAPAISSLAPLFE